MHDNTETDDDLETSSCLGYDRGLDISPDFLLRSDSSDFTSICNEHLNQQAPQLADQYREFHKPRPARLSRQRSWTESQGTLQPRLSRLRRHNSDNLMLSFINNNNRLDENGSTHTGSLRGGDLSRSSMQQRGIFYFAMVKSAIIHGRVPFGSSQLESGDSVTPSCREMCSTGCALDADFGRAKPDVALSTAGTTNIASLLEHQANASCDVAPKQQSTAEVTGDFRTSTSPDSSDSFTTLERLPYLGNDSAIGKDIPFSADRDEESADEMNETEMVLASPDIGEPSLTRLERSLMMRKRPILRQNTNQYLLAPPDYRINSD